MPEPANENLLRAAASGDQVAFDALVGPLLEPGFRLAVSMLESRAEGEDALQEATIKAWRNLHRLKDADSVRSWFLTIVANQCRSVRRGRWWSVLKPGEIDRPSSSPETTAIENLDLNRALDSLSTEDRTALMLRYYLDLPLEEVAQILGISMTAARSRVHRAARRMRPALETASGEA